MKIILTVLTALFLAVTAASARDVKAEGFVTNSADGKAVTSFTSDAPKLFALVKTTGTEKGAQLRGAWIAEDVGAAAPANTKIDEATVTGPSGDFSATFSLSKPNAGWPVGKYRVEVYAGEKIVATLKFSITAAK